MESSRHKKQTMVHGTSRSVRAPRDERFDTRQNTGDDPISTGIRDRRRVEQGEENNVNLISPGFRGLKFRAPNWSSKIDQTMNIVGDEGMG